MRIAISLSFVLVACGNDHGVEIDPQAEPVYYGEVQRILDDNCISCHDDSPDRLAPFSLVGYDNAALAAEATPLAFTVMNRIMPPYYAKDDGSCQTFHDTKWLTDDQIDTLVRWTNGSRLEGTPVASIPPPPKKELPAVDATLDIGIDYMPKGVADDFRCFVVDAVAANDMFLTGVHVRPGNATVVHHVIVYTLNDDAAQTDVMARDANDPAPGYECTNGAGEGTTFLSGWAPGTGVSVFPQDTGVLVPGNRKLVIQMHYNSSNTNGEPDRTQIDLDLADTVAKRAMILSVRGNVDLPPREVDALATGTFTLPNAGIESARVWGGAIHMHTRGTGAQVHVQRSSGTCMLDLDGWSFHWQHFYWYEEPFTVTRGETLRVTCHYDTTADTQRIGWGEGTGDEMCLAVLYISL